MKAERRAIAGGVLAGLIALTPEATHAELKDYQISRLIMLKSECQLAELTRELKADGSVVFSGLCKNTSHYPDGIRIVCPDVEDNDERTCNIATKPKRFENLRLLQQADEQ